MKITEALGNFISEASFEDLPPKVIETAKDRILDLLGVELLGYSLGTHKHIFNILGKNGSRESTIIGEGIKAPCHVATFINSCMANLFLTDGSRVGGVHPSASVIPASLAVGERENISGRDLILSVVLGYEAMIRVAAAMHPSCFRRGFHPTSVVSSIGSAASAGRLFKLGSEGMANCLSVAATLSTGLMNAFKAGDYLAEMQVARGAEAGVLAALFAQSGFKGYKPIFEEGFFRAFSDEYSIDVITKELGNQFSILKTYMKQHWACGHLLAPIDATMELLEKYSIRADDVRQVNVYTYSLALETDISEPRTGKDADFSLPFVISVLLIDGSVSPEKFIDAKVRDKQILDLMKKVNPIVDPEIDRNFPYKRQVRVEIVTQEGKKYSQELNWFKGEPEWPLNKQEIEKKFLNLASKIGGEHKSKKAIAFLDRLEEAKVIRPLFPLLRRREK